MNDKIRELYVEFHTKRRLKIEELTEARFQHYIKEGCNNSPAIRKDALYWAMEQTSEEEQFSDFAQLIVQECIKQCSLARLQILVGMNTDFSVGKDMGMEVCIDVIKDHFGGGE